MGYVVLDTEVPAARKMIISLWFRVPQTSIDACFAARATVGPIHLPFNGVIPLIVFGKAGGYFNLVTNPHQTPLWRAYDAVWEGTEPDFTSEVVGSSIEPPDVILTEVDHIFPNLSGYHWQEFLTLDFAGNPYQVDAYTSNTQTTGERIDWEPSYIGLDCVYVQGKAMLIANLETNKKATITKYDYDISGITPQVIYQGGSRASGTETYLVTYRFGIFQHAELVSSSFTRIDAPSSDTGHPVYTYRDRSNVVFGAATQYYYIDGGERFGERIQVTADHWHHVLLSFDLIDVKIVCNNDPVDDNIAVNVQSASRCWLAFDDVNINKDKMSSLWPKGSSDDNAIIPNDAKSVARSGPLEQTFTGSYGTNGPPPGIPTYTLTNITIPESKPGLPATAKYVNSIYEVELAELQIFLGKTVNTKLEADRRLFITKKDDKGIQKPTRMSVAQKELGKPAVKLHGTGNWKKGRNTGSLAENPIKDGVSVGEIKTYKPDPNLNGKQGT